MDYNHITHIYMKDSNTSYVQYSLTSGAFSKLFEQACKVNDLPFIEHAIEKKHKTYDDLLHVAVLQDNLELVQYAIEHNATRIWSYILDAIHNNNVDIVKCLLCGLLIPHRDAWPLLNAAFSVKSNDIAKIILSYIIIDVHTLNLLTNEKQLELLDHLIQNNRPIHIRYDDKIHDACIAYLLNINRKFNHHRIKRLKTNRSHRNWRTQHVIQQVCKQNQIELYDPNIARSIISAYISYEEFK